VDRVVINKGIYGIIPYVAVTSTCGDVVDLTAPSTDNHHPGTNCILLFLHVYIFQ